MGSSLDFVKPVLHLLPEVQPPQRPTTLPEKLLWTAIALVLFFVMYHVVAVGVRPTVGGADFLQVVTASKIGSLITVGIGPIVLASIFLQLFAGAKIIKVDMSDPAQKRTFQGAQKLLAILLCFFEAAVFVIFARVALIPLFPSFGEGTFIDPNTGNEMVSAPYTTALVILQIALGSLVLLYLDEVVSKYGIGSGISLFIAAGVSASIVGGTFSILFGQGGVVEALSSGSAEALPNAIMALLPLFFTLLVFLVVSYAEGVKVEIPLAFDRARGLGSRFPIKLLYVSNIPVILASALLLNVQFFAISLQGQHWCITGQYDPAAPDYDKCSGGFDLVAHIAYVDSGKQLRDGILYYLSPIYRPLHGNYGGYINQLLTATTPIMNLPEWVHVLTYTVFIVFLCIIFGQFWVETTGMGPKEVAEQLDKSGLQIPGFRRDPRIVEKVLENYIPYIVVIGSAFVGLLAALADMTGALGTGTGILLTVGILYRMYQDLENQRLFDTYASIGGLMKR
ncbi:MAG: preprotein translocase subunit SecY [Candidatus Micrarchaeota archaeon]|nr:preprotein translocase subunit SecY [Candidatus Micrarchaeota archaeon]